MITTLRTAGVERVVERVAEISVPLVMPAALSGHIELLPSGHYRVHVYGGTDSVTGKPRRVRRTVTTEAKAAQELANLLRDAEAERSPDDTATFGVALGLWVPKTYATRRYS